MTRHFADRVKRIDLMAQNHAKVLGNFSAVVHKAQLAKMRHVEQAGCADCDLLSDEDPLSYVHKGELTQSELDCMLRVALKCAVSPVPPCLGQYPSIVAHLLPKKLPKVYLTNNDM